MSAGYPLDQVEISDPQRLVAAPVVSVLMLAYNHAAYLPEAIESVMAQTCEFPYELIIGEDNSSDASRAIALRYQQQFPERIRVIHSAGNVGAYANHRRVVAAARGEFVAYCEGDDYWCRADKLAAQVALLRADEGATMAHADWVRAKPVNGGWRVDWRHPMHRRLPERLLHGDLFHVFYFAKILRTCTMMQRRSALQAFHASKLAQTRYRFVDTVRSAYLAAMGRVVYWPEIAAVYRESPGSALRSGRQSFLLFLRSSLEFDTAAREYFRERSDYPRNYRWECAVGLVMRSLRLGDFAGARAAMRDLREHFDAKGSVSAAVTSLRLRWPTMRANVRRLPPASAG